MKFKSLLLIVLLFCSVPALAQPGGFQIRVKVAGLNPGDTCYMGNYYGRHQYLKDTAVVNDKGEFVFSGQEPLDGGIYFIVVPVKKFFEFIINQEQNITLETSKDDFIMNMKVKGSRENSVFYEYLKYTKSKQNSHEVYKTRHQQHAEHADSAAFYKTKMSEVEKEIQDYKLQFVEKNPDFLISKVFIAAKDPDVPEAPILPNGRKDSLFQYNYYKANFFENMDFSDDRLLRTPVFYNRLNFFMEKVVIQIPDSIIKEADKLIEKGRGNDEIFKYLVWYFTHTYETSDIMGFDAVFVHTVENYYMTGQAFWVSPTILENLTKRAMKLKPILIGKIAPNLIMQDTSLNLQALHAVKAAYTVLYFWDPECGHCGVDLPKFHRYYLENKEELDFEVFSVCTDTNWVEMKKFIRKHNLTWINVNGPRAATKSFADLYDIHSTPVMFILDEKKAIIAKRLGSEKVDSFIKSHRKMKAEMRD